MAKDPATLWYWSDWHSGTTTLSRFLKGCYMDLLHAQFNSGPLSLDEVKTVLSSDFGAAWPSLVKKFSVNPDGLFFNERLESEKIKRKAFTKSRVDNLKGKSPHMEHHMNKHMGTHMDNRDRNEDVNKEKGSGEKPIFWIGPELNKIPQYVKPSEWMRSGPGQTFFEQQMMKHRFTVPQVEDLLFKFDLDKSSTRFDNDNHVKNSFKVFCDMRDKELSGTIKHHQNGNPIRDKRPNPTERFSTDTTPAGRKMGQ